MQTQMKVTKAKAKAPIDWVISYYKSYRATPPVLPSQRTPFVFLKDRLSKKKDPSSLKYRPVYHPAGHSF